MLLALVVGLDFFLGTRRTEQLFVAIVEMKPAVLPEYSIRLSAPRALGLE